MDTKWNWKERITSGVLALIIYNILLILSIIWQVAFAVALCVAIGTVQWRHIDKVNKSK